MSAAAIRLGECCRWHSRDRPWCALRGWSATRASADRHPCPRQRRRRPAAHADGRASRSGQRRSPGRREVRGNRSSRVCRCRACPVFSCRHHSQTACRASTRSALRSQTATMRLSRPATPVNCRTPGISWPREMRPTPMAPMVMRLEGAVAPKTELGTMAGNPAAMAPDEGTLNKFASCGNHGSLFREPQIRCGPNLHQ